MFRSFKITLIVGFLTVSISSLMFAYTNPNSIKDSMKTTGTNPFFTASTLPFQAPPFDKIKDSDYKPALEKGMKDQLAEIEKIADNPAPPTFENTLVALEKSGQLLNRVNYVFNAVTNANTDSVLTKNSGRRSPETCRSS